MIIEVKNSNNIEKATINVDECKLNIKLAPNGSGKSTIAKAILASLNASEGLLDLLPFKYREENPDNIVPEISGLDVINSVMCFNEDYVRQFNFKQEEVVSNSFEIFIRNDEYKDLELKIQDLVKETRNAFANNDELESLITSISELSAAFKLTKTGVSKASVGMKSLVNGNKIEHIPEGLELYKPFIQSSDSVKWVDWQTKGNEFSDLSECCPFCTSNTKSKKNRL